MKTLLTLMVIGILTNILPAQTTVTWEGKRFDRLEEMVDVKNIEGEAVFTHLTVYKKDSLIFLLTDIQIKGGRWYKVNKLLFLKDRKQNTIIHIVVSEQWMNGRVQFWIDINPYNGSMSIQIPPISGFEGLKSFTKNNQVDPKINFKIIQK